MTASGEPSKGYFTLKEVLSGARDADGTTTTVTTTMEDLRQSPRGIWYRRLVRENVVREGPGGASDAHEKVTRFFVDFNAELPDDLFRGVAPATPAFGQ